MNGLTPGQRCFGERLGWYISNAIGLFVVGSPLALCAMFFLHLSVGDAFGPIAVLSIEWSIIETPHIRKWWEGL